MPTWPTVKRPGNLIFSLVYMPACAPEMEIERQVNCGRYSTPIRCLCVCTCQIRLYIYNRSGCLSRLESWHLSLKTNMRVYVSGVWQCLSYTEVTDSTSLDWLMTTGTHALAHNISSSIHMKKFRRWKWNHVEKI